MARDDKLVRGDDALMLALQHLSHARQHIAWLDGALRDGNTDFALMNATDAIRDLNWCRRYVRRIAQ